MINRIAAAQRSDWRPRLDLVFFDAGGGHRASATALRAVIENQRRPWRVRMVNLREMLGPIDLVRRTTGVCVENLYNRLMLQHGLTLGSGPMLRATQALIRATHRRQVVAAARWWCPDPPDLVVSMIPNFNRGLFDGLRAADSALERPPTPMVTVLTDLADHPPHFWIERQDQYFICGTARAVEQALAMGHPREHVFRTSGMIVRPDFYMPIEMSRADERARLGLSPDLTTGLVCFGGYGSRRMLEIAERVAAAGLKTQLIFLCGRNQRLIDRLTSLKLPYPHHVEGFTTRVPHYMRLADYFIGKPGPGSISEALVSGLPVIVESNRWTMVQERYNTEWITAHQVGVVLHSFAEIATGILPMLDAERLASYRERVRAIGNRAVLEIPEMLAEILAAHRGWNAAAPWLDERSRGPSGAAA